VRVLSSMKRRRTALEEAGKDDFSEAAKEKPSQFPNPKVVNCTASKFTLPFHTSHIS
jgi:hypothetical protein